MSHARRNPTEADLREWGYQKQPDGTWAKSGHMDGLQKSQPQSDSKRSPRTADTIQKTSKSKVERKPVVCFYGMRRRILDDDNFRGGLKHLRDAIAQTLNRDDREAEIEWRYQQVKIKMPEKEGTLVKIFYNG